MNTLFYAFTIGSLLAIILIFLVYFLKKVSKTNLQQIFGVDMILIITTSVFILLQMQLCKRFPLDPVYFAKFYYIGIVFFPISLYFTVKIFENEKFKFKPIYLLLFIIPLISLLGLWTNGKTHVFFVSYDIDLNRCTFGPLFIINEIYSYIFYFLTILNLMKVLKKNYGFFTGHLTLFMAGIIFPFTLNLLAALGIINFTIYITPIASSISIICFTLAIFKFKLVDTLPIALSKIVNRISDGYIVLDEKNIITNHNLTFSKILEIKNQNIDNIHFFDLLRLNELQGIDETTVINAINSVRNSNETLILEKYLENINKYIRFEITNLKSNSSLLGILILIKDITEHQKDLEILKSNQTILIERDRLASLGEMISGVTHDLKTPLFSISGATEGLNDLIEEYKSSIDDPSVTIEDHKEIATDMQNWIYKIKNYTSYMSDIITTVRGQAASFTESTLETFTISEVLKRVNILMKHELQQALIELNIEDNTTQEIKLQGNMNTLIQALNNLISNAIQSYEGRQNQSVDLKITNTKTKVKITITDYGVPVPDEVKDKLFKEIITSKGSSGTGLGLFTSYTNIKNEFKGDITFSSDTENGTSFEITLPFLKD